MPDVTCTITIHETGDGKVAISANIPDGKSVAKALATQMMDLSVTIMNAALNEDKKLEKVTTQ